MNHLDRRIYNADVHDRPLYIICSEVLSTVGETSYGIHVGFITLFLSEVQTLFLSS
jgi:hypothetical protein